MGGCVPAARPSVWGGYKQPSPPDCSLLWSITAQDWTLEPPSLQTSEAAGKIVVLLQNNGCEQSHSSHCVYSGRSAVAGLWSGVSVCGTNDNGGADNQGTCFNPIKSGK